MAGITCNFLIQGGNWIDRNMEERKENQVFLPFEMHGTNSLLRFPIRSLHLGHFNYGYIFLFIFFFFALPRFSLWGEISCVIS